MSGTDMPPGAQAGSAVVPKTEPQTETAAVQPAEPAPAETGLPAEQAKQDEAMSVTTVPDEPVKQEAAEAQAEQAGAGAAGAALTVMTTLPPLSRGEVVLTPAEAKMQKLAKGYSLQPVLVNPVAEAAPPLIVSGKRERKKSNHFGHSPDNEPDMPARPKAARPVGRPSAVEGQHSNRAASAYIAVDTAPSSTPWITDKKRQLQERLARLNKQLKKFAGPAPALQGAFHLAPSPAPASPGLWHHGGAQTPMPMYHGQTPASRSDGVSSGTPDLSSNGRARERKRPREGSEGLPGAILGVKKPKMKKGQERLAPTGKLRNLYLHSEKLVEGLMKEKMAMAYFNVPVDPEALGIPHYRDIINNPMDLGTVKGKLEGGFYCGVETLANDIFLVFDNAMTFNPPGTDVHECAKALKDISEKRIKRLPKAPAQVCKSSLGGGVSSANLSDSPGIGTPTGAGMSTAADQRKMADMMRKMEQMQRDLELVKNKGSAQKKTEGSSKKKSSASTANRVMTFEDKRTLSLNINKLPHEKLGKVVEIIKKRRSNVVGGASEEEIEIDIDLLDNATLKELDKYVKECLNPSKPKASKASALQSAAAEVVGAVGAVGGVKDVSESESDTSDSDGN